MGSIERQSAVLIGRYVRPAYFDAFADQRRLEGMKMVIVFLHLMRCETFFQAVGRKHSSHFADIPFDRMQPVATVGDMRRADILVGWNEVLHALRDQRAERNLEGAGRHVDVIVAAGRWMQIDAIHADADAVAIPESPLSPRTV